LLDCGSVTISLISFATLSSIWWRMKCVVDHKITPNSTMKLRPVMPA
jgi:hypothetical protein